MAVLLITVATVQNAPIVFHVSLNYFYFDHSRHSPELFGSQSCVIELLFFLIIVVKLINSKCSWEKDPQRFPIGI